MDELPVHSGFGTDRARPTLGSRLQSARLAGKLELADIAHQTRVPLRHLGAIEADDHDSLPALPYTIGFVKTLARAVGVDADEAATQYRAETSKVPHVPQSVQMEPVDESRVPPRWLVAAALALIVVVIGAVWAYGEGMFGGSREPAQTAPVTEEIASAPPAAAQPVPAAQPGAAATQPEVADGDAASPGEPAAGEGVVAAEQSDDPAAAPAVGSVVITATDDAWFKVYDKATRQSVKMGILKAGERYVVPGDRDDLLLWTGKAGALRLTVNGRAVAPLGGPEQMVKDVPLNPAALAARGG